MNTTATATESMRGKVRHTTMTVLEAQRMARGGMTAHEIQQALTRYGTPVAWATVKAWIDDDYRITRNRISAEDNRRHRDVAGDHFKQRVRELREQGMTYKAISTVARVYHGRDITHHQVRLMCEHLGLPKDPLMARPQRSTA